MGWRGDRQILSSPPSRQRFLIAENARDTRSSGKSHFIAWIWFWSLVILVQEEQQRVVHVEARRLLRHQVPLYPSRCHWEIAMMSTRCCSRRPPWSNQSCREAGVARVYPTGTIALVRWVRLRSIACIGAAHSNQSSGLVDEWPVPNVKM